MRNFLSIILLFIFLSSVQAIETKIVHSIQGEIITNTDIKKEIKYLLSLNNNLKELDKEVIFDISNRSIIKEKIKQIEISKYFKKIELNIEYLDILLKQLYIKQGLKSLDEFKTYLKNYDLILSDVEKKITIEALWNQLVMSKYASLIEIDEERINRKIRNNVNNQTREYLLSESVFEIKNKDEIKKKYKEILKIINEKGFKNAASIYSVSESSKIGGDIGWINAKSLNSKIKTKISVLNKGEVSQPINIPNGILILKISDTRNIEIKTDYNLELKKAINYEKTRQLDQYSKIYFNKVKKNLEFNE